MKDKIISFLFVGVLLCGFISFLIVKDREVSEFERRKLLTKESLKDGITDHLEDYLKDQFISRDALISVNSMFDRYVLGNKESNNVYIEDGFLIEKNYPQNNDSIDNFIKKMNLINDRYLQDSNVFMSIIPDKSYFLINHEYLKMDFVDVLGRIKNGIHFDCIEFADLLKLSDYYKTDIHIKQESYLKLMERMNQKLDFGYKKQEYKVLTFDDFYGASYSKGSIFLKPDKINLLYNETINRVKAKHLEYGIKDIYELERLNDVDAYNVFLGGPSSLIEIENIDAKSEKELILFRDSFGSSLAPLLVDYYKKITLIDLRYIKMDKTQDYVDFVGKDVLFLYSTLIINNSYLLKI